MSIKDIEGTTCRKCKKGILKHRGTFGVGIGKYFPLIERYKCFECKNEFTIIIPATHPEGSRIFNEVEAKGKESR